MAAPQAPTGPQDELQGQQSPILGEGQNPTPPTSADETTEAVPTTAEELLKAADAEMAAQQEKERQALQALHTAREAEVKDKRLLSLDGIADIAKTLGVKWQGETLTAQNAREFLVLCLKNPTFQNLIGVALQTLVFGQIALNEGKLPFAQAHEYEEPIASYLVSLQFFDDWLDAHAQNLQAPQSASTFFDRRCKAEWNRAVEAAVKVREGIVERLRNADTGEVLTLGEKTEVAMLLHDKQGRHVVNFRTFGNGETSLAEDKSLQERFIPSIGRFDKLDISNFDDFFNKLDLTSFEKNLPKNIQQASKLKSWAPSKPQRNFRDLLVPETEYPDQAVVDAAKVKNIVAVLPIAPDRPESLFKIGFNGGTDPFEVEIITGEGWHTERTGLVDLEGGQMITGIPSALQRGQEEFFSAKTAKALGEKRTALKEETGETASQQVVLVIKPMVDGHKACSHRALAQFRTNQITAEDAMKIILKEPAATRESIFAFQTKGYITKEQAQELMAAQKKLEAPQPQDIKEILRNLEAATRGSEFTKGGSPFSTFRGGSSGSIGSVESLYTGSSQTRTGAEFTTVKKTAEPDPLKSPTILVITTLGITGTESEDPTEKLAKVISMADRRKKTE